MAIDASTVNYTAPFTSAITRALNAWMAEHISVKDFGAAGDGVTDDRAAFQAAVNYVKSIGGGQIYVPRGIYALSGYIDTTGANNMRITGEGIDASVLKITSSTSAVLYATGSTMYRTFDNFSITSAAAHTTTFIDFEFERRGLFHRIRLQQHLNGISLRGFEQTTLSEVFIVNPSGAGTALVCGLPGTSNTGANLNLIDCFFRGNNELINDDPKGAIALAIYDVEAVFCVNSDFGNFRDQIMVVSPQTVCRNLHFVQTYFDGTKNGDNVLFTGQGLKTQFQFTGCWFNGAGQLPGGLNDVFGAHFNNLGTYSDLNFTGCRFVSQKGSGVFSSTPYADFTFSGCVFVNCATTSSSYRYAVQFEPASTQVNFALFGTCKFTSSANALYDFRFNTHSRGNVVNGCMLQKGFTFEFGAFFGKCVGNADATADTIPSADPLILSPTKDYYNITGSTTVGTIPQTYPGHQVTLVASGTMTFNESASLHLAGNYSTTNGSVLTLVCEPSGGGWREISRTNT